MRACIGWSVFKAYFVWEVSHSFWGESLAECDLFLCGESSSAKGNLFLCEASPFAEGNLFLYGENPSAGANLVLCGTSPSIEDDLFLCGNESFGRRWPYLWKASTSFYLHKPLNIRMSHLFLPDVSWLAKTSIGNINQSFRWSCLLLFNLSNDCLFFETINASSTCGKRAELLKIVGEPKRYIVVLTSL